MNPLDKLAKKMGIPTADLVKMLADPKALQACADALAPFGAATPATPREEAMLSAFSQIARGDGLRGAAANQRATALLSAWRTSDAAKRARTVRR